jgi:tetratricopeptide (TPR) repeat protein
VVDEIAQAVAQELDRRQRGDTADRLPRHRTRSIPAYELYLRGDDPALLRSDSSARRGLEYFRRAVAIDSSYAAAWVGVARMTLRTAYDGHPDSLKKARVLAEAAVRKALALDDSLAEAHANFGVQRAMVWDFPAAERHFRRAIDLEPRTPRWREWFTAFLLLTGRPVEALAEAERALALNPLSPSATAELARALGANNRCDEALARLETIAKLDPPLLRAPLIAAQCYGRQGRWAEAIEVLRSQAERGEYLALSLLGYMRGRAGQREEALSIQSRLQDRYRSGAIGAFYLVFVPTGLGDLDQAFTWLDRAYQDGSLRFQPGRFLDLTAPPFDHLRQDPRMDRLVERLGIQKR